MSRSGFRARQAMIRRRSRVGGVTLVEVLVAMALVALLFGGAMIGLGAIGGARLREATTLVAGAIRTAYNHANATSRTTRLVFDFETRTVAIEESDGLMLLESGDRTGGAAGVTELEKEAIAVAEEIVEGPRAPRPEFHPVKTLGFEPDQPSGKELPSGIRLRAIEVEHEDDPVDAERVYLYFWPGGQTERAAIQLTRGGADEVDDGDIMTVSVMPLTGQVMVDRGRVEMPRPRDEEEASEREDPDL